MPTGDSGKSGDALGEVLDEYLAACEAGTPPDRSTWLRRYPQLADSLGNALDAIDRFRDVSQRLRTAARNVIPGMAANPEQHLPFQLGDFVLRRELGRGGMGIVYEAEQCSLQRRVAFKVLPIAAALDDACLQRFQLEAQIAACLHHRNIVPIYGVGSESGIHYYAMQLIEGYSAAEWLKRESEARVPATKDPESRQKGGVSNQGDSHPQFASQSWWRRVAEVGVQAAEALAYAHTQGVIHRDIKPSNLLIDSTGSLLITDFGVAFHSRRSDIAITLAGDVVGTLNYASPEQAAGQRDRIDGRSDVYSLGATLYELLSGSRPFLGNNRDELLSQITHDNPKPLCTMNSAIPRDLETIVLKCLAKSPDERYASAADLAADLRRFLDGRAVLAKRPGFWQHAEKWAKRNRAILGVTTATLVLGVLAGVGLSAAAIARSYAEAERQREVATRAAEYIMKAAATDEKIAGRLIHVGGTGEAQREYYRLIAEMTEYLAELPGATQQIRWRVARAYWGLGAVEARTLEADAAVAAFEVAVERGEALIRDYPDQFEYRVEVANFRYQLANALSQRAQPGDREKSYQITDQAWRELEGLASKQPNKSPLREYLLNVRTAVADRWYVQGRYPEAIGVLEKLRYVNKSLANRYPDHPLSHIRLNSNWHMIGKNYLAMRNYPEAERCLREAVRCDQQLRALPTAKPTDREPTWSARGILADHLLNMGRLQEAEEQLTELTRDIEPIANSVPEAGWFRDVGQYFGSLGKAYYLLDRLEESQSAFERSAELLKDWPPQKPEFSVWVWNLALNPQLSRVTGLELRGYVPQLKQHHAGRELTAVTEALLALRSGEAEQACEMCREALGTSQDSLAQCRLQYVLALSLARLGQAAQAEHERTDAESLRAQHDLRDVDLALMSRELDKAMDNLTSR